MQIKINNHGFNLIVVLIFRLIKMFNFFYLSILLIKVPIVCHIFILKNTLKKIHYVQTQSPNVIIQIVPNGNPSDLTHLAQA